MGFQRDIVEALIANSREQLDTADQAIDVMYDPLRHAFFAGNDVVDEVVSRINNTNCIICMHPARSHDANSEHWMEERAEQPAPPQVVPLHQYLSQL